MALVSDLVARFRVDVGDYTAKLDSAKAKNRELAASLLETAGSADKAIATLKVAGGKNALGDIGVDKRQVSGITSEIRSLSKETATAASAAHHLGDELRNGAKEAKGYDRVVDSLGTFGKGDFLGGIASFRRGMAAIKAQANEGGPAFGNSLLGVGLAATAIGLVAKGLDDVTTKAVKLRQEFLDGSKTGGQIADELIKTIPVLGSIYTAGQNIRLLVGLENNDLEESIALQDRMNVLRKDLVDILKQSNQEAKKFSEGTDDIISHTHVVNLEAHGDDAQAKSADIAGSLVRTVRDTAEQAAKEAQGHIDTINARINTPAKEGGKSASQEASAAESAAAKAKQTVLDAQANVASEQQGMSGGHGDFASGDGYLDALRRLEDAKQASADADAKAAQLSGPVTAANKERAEVEANLTKELRARVAAQVDASAADVAKQFGPDDSRALGAQAGATRIKAQADVILSGAEPVEDRIKALGELLRTSLGDNAAKAFAGVDVGKIDAQAAGKKLIDSLKGVLDGKEPVKDWLNKQLGGDALGSTLPGAIAKWIGTSTPPYVKVQVQPTGDIKTWLTHQDGTVVADVVPKGTDLEAWLKARNLDVPVGFTPKGMSLDQWLKAQGGQSVNIDVHAKAPNITDLVARTLQGNPVSEWLDRQTNKVLKGRSISEWIKSELEQGQKDWEALRQEAQKFRDGLKTPVEKLRVDLDQENFMVKLHLVGEDDLKKNAKKLLTDITGDENKKAVKDLKDKIDEAQELLSRGLVSKDDVGTFLNKNSKDLQRDKRGLEDDLDRPVYNLPDVKNTRGQTLYAPPTRNDEKQLEKLDAIRQELQDLNDAAAKDDVTLKVIGS